MRSRNGCFNPRPVETWGEMFTPTHKSFNPGCVSIRAPSRLGAKWPYEPHPCYFSVCFNPRPVETWGEMHGNWFFTSRYGGFNPRPVETWGEIPASWHSNPGHQFQSAPRRDLGRNPGWAAKVEESPLVSIRAPSRLGAKCGGFLGNITPVKFQSAPRRDLGRN